MSREAKYASVLALIGAAPVAKNLQRSSPSAFFTFEKT
jgi:hypothetical protein